MKKIIDLICCKFLFHVKYIHLENLKNENKYVICPNHSTIFDPTFLYPKVENMATMAKSELFKNKILARIFTALGAFPVDRETKDTKSVLQALKVFEKSNNSKLLIFPEGKVIHKDEPIGKVKNGGVFIAANAKVPIIPIYITRTPNLFSKVYVVVGEEITISQDVLKNKELLKQESQKLLQKIYQLEKEIPSKSRKKQKTML